MIRPDTLVAPLPVLAHTMKARFANLCGRAVEARGVCHVAVTGGSLLTVFGPVLATAEADWACVHMYFGDERAVPAEHALSNYRLAREQWLDRVNIPTDQVHRMPADLNDLEAAACRYEDVLRRHMGHTPTLDIVLLGTGPDGHVCSLFPGHPLLAERERLVAPIFDAPKPPPQRLTMTMPLTAGARTVIVSAVGAEKAGAVRDALRGDLASPLAQVIRAAPSVLMLIDPAAASLLEP